MITQTTTRKIYVAVVILLVLIITIGGIIIWSKYEQGDQVEISDPVSEIWEGTIYIGGAVNLPGYYPCTYDDTIEMLLQASGGITDNYSSDKVVLLLDDSKVEQRTQKIDINRADKWLLKALPGIGEIIAQRIVDFRINNGEFSTTLELLDVDGIGPSVYEQIKEYITVFD
ncbi:MAG: helix-hairpin-helix domain-containing protein [Dehalococcoidales bacterium]|nr:MAG: helix-hairpin-helix domain-containing protein [Dehalococcoidales bacterium]